MALLREAVKTGFSDAARLSTDPILVGLWEREDFKQLLSDLKQQPMESGPR